jgi:anthranilate 1,2-dioxygenase ferredoxin component
MSEIWHSVIAESDFPESGKYACMLGGWYILIARTEEGIFAVNDRCTHASSRLSGGRIRRGAVMCPLHGARFDLASGKCLGAAHPDLRSHAVRIVEGMIEVGVPASVPGVEDIPVLI